MSLDRACLCGSNEASLIQSGVRHDRHASVWRCDRCDLVYQWPRPSIDDLAKYYGGDYRNEYTPASLADLHQVAAADTTARVARLAGRVTADTSLLDVGAGFGSFVEAIQRSVATVTAIEPDAPSRKHLQRALGVPAVRSLADLPADARFDLITLFHVLEHIPDPRCFLADLGHRLLPQGTLVVEVPNVDDALVSAYRSSAYTPFYFQKAHLFYFSPCTLERLAGEAGLAAEVELVQRYGLRNHLHWLTAGEPGGDHRYTDVVLDTADVAYRTSLVETGHADTIWLVAHASSDPAR